MEQHNRSHSKTTLVSMPPPPPPPPPLPPAARPRLTVVDRSQSIRSIGVVERRHRQRQQQQLKQQLLKESSQSSVTLYKSTLPPPPPPPPPLPPLRTSLHKSASNHHISCSCCIYQTINRKTVSKSRSVKSELVLNRAMTEDRQRRIGFTPKLVKNPAPPPPLPPLPPLPMTRGQRPPQPTIQELESISVQASPLSPTPKSTCTTVQPSHPPVVFFRYLKKFFSIFRRRNRPADIKVQQMLEKRKKNFYKRWSGATRIRLTGMKHPSRYPRDYPPDGGQIYAVPQLYPRNYHHPVAFYHHPVSSKNQHKQLLMQQFVRRHHEIMASLSKKRFCVSKMFSQLSLMQKPRPQYQFLNLLYQTVVRNNRMSGYRYGLIRPVDEELNRTRSTLSLKPSFIKFSKQQPKEMNTLPVRPLAGCLKQQQRPKPIDPHRKFLDSLQKGFQPVKKRSSAHFIPQSNTNCIDCYLAQLSNLARSRNRSDKELNPSRMQKSINGCQSCCQIGDHYSLSSSSSETTDCCCCSLYSSCGSSCSLNTIDCGCEQQQYSPCQSPSPLHPKQWPTASRKKRMSTKVVDSTMDGGNFPTKCMSTNRIDQVLHFTDQHHHRHHHHHHHQPQQCSQQRPGDSMRMKSKSHQQLSLSQTDGTHNKCGQDYYDVPKVVCLCPTCATKYNIPVANV